MAVSLPAPTPSVGTVLALGPQWLDPSYLIAALGPFVLAGLCLIIFAECGLLVGFFLPGDSLLFTAGLFVASGAISVPLWLVCVLLVISALAGNVCGYWIGRAVGPAIFDRPNSRVFKHEHVERTAAFFAKYGNRAIVLGRFVPIVRTFITVMAGVGRMQPRRYLTYSVVGGVAWAAGVTLLGYFLGGFAVVREHIELMLVGVVALSVVPLVVELVKVRRERRRGVDKALAEGREAPDLG
jgi:membrane-associated protein